MTESVQEQRIQLLSRHVSEARERFPGLKLIVSPEYGLVVQGRVGFSTTWKGEEYEDDFLIELRSLDAYPSPLFPPAAYELEGRVGKDFEHFMADGSFCLGAPIEVRIRFALDQSVLGFIDKQVIPYLFSYCYKSRHGYVPYGEREHGFMGVLEFYTEALGTTPLGVLQLLKLLADNFAPPAGQCPCGSKLKLKDCHGPKLDLLRPFSTPNEIGCEMLLIIEDAMKKGYAFPKAKVLPKVVSHRLRRRNRGSQEPLGTEEFFEQAKKWILAA